MTNLPKLNQIGEELWLVEGSIVNFYGFPYPTRMLIARLPNNDLWIWSPISLSKQLNNLVNSLGRVAHLVSPNKLHHLFLDEWLENYPKAKLWGPTSTIKKRKELAFQPPLQDKPPAEWQGAIDQFWMRGSFFFDEIIFFHKSSKTAIIADLSEHFSEKFLKTHWKGWKQKIARLWGITEGVGYAPLEIRLTWHSKKKARGNMKKLIALKPEMVVMAHGEWINNDGTAFLKRAFDWLLR